VTKEELVHLTLKQLQESLKLTPENFRLDDVTTGTTNNTWPGPTIIWQYRILLDEDKYIPDPLNSVKTIIVTYNKVARTIQCSIYNREVNALTYGNAPEVIATVAFNPHIPLLFFRTYRQFMSIRGSILKRRNDKEFMDYMKRLNGIFPSTHEDELFK
jgi:hypothetical protein